MPARQLSLEFGDGVSVVEVRNSDAGWSESVQLESRHGEFLLEGARPERIESVAEEPLAPADIDYWRAEAGAAAGDGSRTAFERAYALCGWVAERTYGRKAETRREGGRRQQDHSKLSGREVLADVDAGAKLTFVSTSAILHDAARALGLRTRRVDLGVRHVSPFEAHSVVEVWDPALRKWAVVDPTFDAVYRIGGVPAGALEIHKAVVLRKLAEVEVDARKGSPAPDPFTYKIDPLLFFRNISVLLPGGYWLTRVGPATPPPPITSPSHLLEDYDEPFTTDRDPLDKLEVFRGAKAGKLAYQVVGGRLYVCVAEDVYTHGAMEVRVSDGHAVEFHPDTPPYDPNDAQLLRPVELLADPDFATLGKSSESWRVTGKPSIEREAAGVVVEAEEGPCEIADAGLPFADVSYVGFLELEVEEGEVSFGIGDVMESVPQGPARRMSTRVLLPRGSAGLVIRLGSGARCRLVKASLRRAKPLYEALGLPEPKGAPAGPSEPVRGLPYDPFRGRRR